EPPARQGRYDWSVLLEAVDGGLIETADGLRFQAPATGYRARIEYAFKAADSTVQWNDELQRRFYLRSGGGQTYASLDLVVRADPAKGAGATVTYTANPAGSRNLEYDPAKALQPIKSSR